MPTISDQIAELLEVEVRLATLEARKTELRNGLLLEAETRWEADGAAPSWKAKGLGSVTLVVPAPALVIASDEHLAAWVKADGRPEEVIRSVRKSYLEVLKTRLILDPDAGAAVDPETGEKVPGTGVNVRRPYLTVRLDPEAKARALDAQVVDTAPTRDEAPLEDSER